MPRRKLHIHADKLSFSDQALQQYDGAANFDDRDGWDLEGQPVHDDQPDCDHCKLRAENVRERERAYRLGVAFARFLDSAAPPQLIEGMLGFWSGELPYSVVESN